MNITNVLECIIVAAILAALFPITKNGVRTMDKLNFAKIKSEYGTDITKETEGVWFKSSFVPGFEMKIARAGNKVNEKLMRKLYKPYSKTLRAGRDLPDDVTDELSNELLVETILMDWKGLPGEEGEIVYSKDAAYQLLEDIELKELKKEIQEFADDFSRYKSEDTEELVKN